MRGRLIAQWTALIWEAVFLFVFSQITVLGGAIACLIMFSLGVQMSEGTSYGELLSRFPPPHPSPLPTPSPSPVSLYTSVRFFRAERLSNVLITRMAGSFIRSPSLSPLGIQNQHVWKSRCE